MGQFDNEAIYQSVKRYLSNIILAWLAVFLWMGVIFVLSSIPSLKSPLEPWYDFVLRKLAHVGEFAALAMLVFRAFTLSGGNKKRALVSALGISILYAASDEWHQTFVPGREGTPLDVAIDVIGIGGAAAYVVKKSAWRVS